jgi:hypothetical protein
VLPCLPFTAITAELSFKLGRVDKDKEAKLIIVLYGM